VDVEAVYFMSDLEVIIGAAQQLDQIQPFSIFIPIPQMNKLKIVFQVFPFAA
jgi:hypothetical protein